MIAEGLVGVVGSSLNGGEQTEHLLGPGRALNAEPLHLFGHAAEVAGELLEWDADIARSPGHLIESDPHVVA